MVGYKVLITASGLGSRLGNLTKFTNKGLVRIGKKPALSYIIESYPDDVEFVVTLGHYGNQVEQFLKLAYPDKNITYVPVENYDGEGSSLLYSQSIALVQQVKYGQCGQFAPMGMQIVDRQLLPSRHHLLLP